MIEPVLVLRMMLPTMAATPGRDQSRGSTDQSSGVIPACAHSFRTTGDQAPYGLRGCVGVLGGVLPEPGQQRHSPDDQNRPARCLPRAHLPAPRCSPPPNRPFAYNDEDCTVMISVVLNTLG